METNLLDRMLSTYVAARTPVTIKLQNRIRVSGRIRAFDGYVIILDGQRREIVYRHAISHLVAGVPDEIKRTAVSRPSPSKKSARPATPVAPKPKVSSPPQPLSASGSEKNINTGMKEGLLRWMQEQKAAK